ncbi:MAG: hypothetical protein AAFX52_11195 [Pseudomonadota bacterium]
MIMNPKPATPFRVRRDAFIDAFEGTRRERAIIWDLMARGRGLPTTNDVHGRNDFIRRYGGAILALRGGPKGFAPLTERMRRRSAYLESQLANQFGRAIDVANSTVAERFGQ